MRCSKPITIFLLSLSVPVLSAHEGAVKGKDGGRSTKIERIIKDVIIMDGARGAGSLIWVAAGE